MNSEQSLATARAYHDAWTSGDFEGAAALLADPLEVEVPVNAYPTKASFAAAVEAFGSLASRVELLAEMSTDSEAMLLYDMEVPGMGQLRIVEHFMIDNGKITRVRQIHDTASLREAGFVSS